MWRRLSTSVLAWTVLAIVLAFGGVTAGKVLLVVLAMAAQLELNSLLKKMGYRANFILPLAVGTILAGFLFAADPRPTLAAALLAIVITHLRNDKPFNLVASLLAVVGICCGLGALAGINALPMANSLWMVVWTVAVVKLADANAYLCGRYLGKRRLAPSISPLKTYEGLMGAVFAGGLVGLMGAPLFIPTHAGFWLGPILGAILALLGSFGDLAESALKRAANVKDSGWVLPGIGGVLDLCDSLILAAPVAWAVLRIVSPT